MIVRLDRRHHPGRAPARRLAPHHPHHRGDGHGRRRHHHPGPVRLRHRRRGRERQASSAGIARPASAGRASGIARAITARRSGSPRRSTPPKSSRRADGSDAMNMQALALAFLAAAAIGGLAWVFLYPVAVGARSKAESRRASVAQVGAGRAPGRQEPALPPRTGRGIAEGSRSAPAEGKEGAAEHAA